MNPYDLRIENLEILVVDDPQRIENEKRFFKNTVNQMLIREQMFGEYRDMEEYFKQLGIPAKFINGWKRTKAKQKKKMAV